MRSSSRVVGAAHGDVVGRGARRTGGSQHGERLYRVTIINRVDRGQPFMPPPIATHSGNVHLFRVGSPASSGTQEIAENGNLAPLLAALSADPAVSDVVAAEAPVVPRRSPAFGTFDDEVTLMISADGDAGSSRGNRC